MNFPKGDQDSCYYGDKGLYDLLRKDLRVISKDCDWRSLIEEG